MSKSDTLRLRDVRAAFRLIGDCRDLGHEPSLWHRRMLEGLLLLFGVLQATAVETWWKRPGTPAQPVAVYRLWPGANGADDAVSRRYCRNQAWRDDPIHQAMEKLPGKLITRTRSQLVSDGLWHGSATFNDYLRGSVDHRAVSVFQVSDDGATSVIALNRALGDRDFSPRERRLLSFFHAEVGRLIGGPLVGATDRTATQLSPRLQQTLARLLEGDSEKQVAASLGLSTATVHQYVTVLYRHFSVQSRAQLLAHAIKRVRNVA